MHRAQSRLAAEGERETTAKRKSARTAARQAQNRPLAEAFEVVRQIVSTAAIELLKQKVRE
jgi:hypothetical protein